MKKVLHPMNETNTPIEFLNLSIRSYNSLKRAGIESIEELNSLTDDQLLAIRNVGELSRAEILQELKEYQSRRTTQDDSTEEISNLDDFDHWVSEIEVADIELSNTIRGALLRAQIQTLSHILDYLRQRDVTTIPHITTKRKKELFRRIFNLARSEKILSEGLFDRESLIGKMNLNIGLDETIRSLGIMRVFELASALSQEAPPLQNLSFDERAECTVHLLAFAHSPLNPRRENIKAPSDIAETDPSLITDILQLLSNLDPRARHIIVRRYGLIGGDVRTLEELGIKFDVTRERIRQIHSRTVRSLRGPRSFALLHKHSTRVEALMERRSVVSASSIWPADIERSSSIELSLGAFCDLFIDLVSIQAKLRGGTEKYWVRLDGLEKLDRVQVFLTTILVANLAPLTKNEVFSRLGDELSADFLEDDVPAELLEYLVATSKAVVFDDDGRVALEKWSRSRVDEMVTALREYGRPLHYSQIADLTNELLPAEQRTSTKNIHAHICRLPDIFVLVGRGVYGLQEWGLHDDGNLANAAYRILHEAATHLSLNELTNRVLQTWDAKPGSVKAAIDLDARFVEFRPGLYILREHLDTSDRQTDTTDKTRISKHGTPDLASDVLLDVLKELGIEINNIGLDLEIQNEFEIVLGICGYEPTEKTIYRDGRRIPLKKKTAEVLELLLDANGEFLKPDQFLSKLWRRGYRGDVGIVESHIHRLRELIEVDPKKPRIITHDPNKGYRISRNVE